MRPWIVALGMLAASGCSWSVTVGQARADFSSQFREVKNDALLARRQAAAARALITRINELVDDRSAAPYPEMARIASSMEMGAEAMRGRAATIRRLRGRLSKLGPKTHVVRRFSPEWKRYATIKSDLDRVRDEAKRSSRVFGDLRSSFEALQRKHDVAPIDTTGYGDRMSEAIKRMDVSVQRASALLIEKGSVAEGEQLDAGQQRRLDGADQALAAMTATRAEVRRLALRFRLETKAGSEAIIAPGMVTFDLFERLDGLEADLKGSLARVESLLAEP